MKLVLHQRLLEAVGFCVLIAVATACGKGGSQTQAYSHSSAVQSVQARLGTPAGGSPSAPTSPVTHEPRQTPNEFSPDLGITVAAAGITLRVFPLDEHERPAPDMKPLLDVRAETGKDGGVVLSFGLTDAVKSGGVFAAVQFDAAKVHPQAFSPMADSTKGMLSLAVLDAPGYVPVGFVPVGAGGALPAGEMGRLTFAAGAASSAKKPLGVPHGPANRPQFLNPINQPNGDIRITFREGLVGDYNHDGLVSIGDLAPLAKYFMTVTTGIPSTQPAYWVDGNSDGEVNISDLVPVADNYGNEVAGYNIYKGASTTPLPNATDPSPDAPTLWRPTLDDLSKLTPPETGDISYPYQYIEHPPHVAATIKYYVAPVALKPPPATGFDVGDKTSAMLDYRGDLTPPAAPTGFAASSKLGEVDLSWSANTESDLAGYNVYFADKAGSATPTLANTGGPVTQASYSLTNLPLGTLYYFRVTAVDTNVPPNESAFSNEITGYPGAPPPSGTLVVDKDYGPMPLAVIFDASGCIPAGMPIDHYNWRFHNTSTIDLVTTSPYATYTYRKMDVYYPSVELIDTLGHSTAFGVKVTVVGQIAYLSSDDPAKTQDLCVINSDGTQQANLTNGTIVPFQFDPSPDGQHILISGIPPSDPYADTHLYVANADGTGLTQITNGGGEMDPRWSHKGDAILYSQFGGEPQVFRCNPDGSNPVNLSKLYSNIPMVAFANIQGAWSRDDSKVAFASTQATIEGYDQYGNQIVRPWQWILVMVGADGSNQVNLTRYLDASSEPLWLDNVRLLFTTFIQQKHQLYTVDLVGTPPAPFIDWPGNDVLHAAASPDGKWVYFEANRYGGPYVFVKDVDGNIRKFYNYGGGAPQHNPDPSPDGTRVTFTQEDTSGMRQIWISDVWGLNATQLTTGLNFNFSARWFPLPPETP